PGHGQRPHPRPPAQDPLRHAGSAPGGRPRGPLDRRLGAQRAVWSVPRVGRGLARADLDNDGRADLLLVAQNSPLASFHNRTGRAGHFVTPRLEGATSNRDAIGAHVTLTGSGRRQTAWRFGGGSYVSAGDPRLHFGLGPARMIEAIEVRWPSGRV